MQMTSIAIFARALTRSTQIGLSGVYMAAMVMRCLKPWKNFAGRPSSEQ